MTTFSKESLETLRRRIDLVEVLSTHLELKRSGTAYKGLCPFHDEKTPSFMIQKGATHYHCFGCGAHGDAIQFLIDHQKMNFLDAVESLAQRFKVHLEKVEDDSEKQGPNKALLKKALESACQFYHLMLLHTPEGHHGLDYLYKRGLDLDFIRHFQIGFAPEKPGMLRNVLHAQTISDEVMTEAGLLAPYRQGSGLRDFFTDRLMFPIRDANGAVIGFSGRKYKEETFGGKYINTPETALFKKSRVLFGLNYSRRRIAKERKALIVEGQIDALRLIYAGYNITVAGQGTAFGDGHVRELMALGVEQVFLALDPDEAGQQAALKIGNLFQKEGVDVRVVKLPKGVDPDAFLRQYGPEQFQKQLDSSIDYLTFIVHFQMSQLNMESPAAKNHLVQEIAMQIRSWGHPVMVHESLRKLAQLTQVPEDTVGVGKEFLPNLYIQKSGTVGLQTVNSVRVMECDFLRWLLTSREEIQQLISTARNNLKPEELQLPLCQKIYRIILSHADEGKKVDLLSLAIEVEDDEAQPLIAEILEKKINKERMQEHFKESLQRILDRNWMEERERIRQRIQSGQCSDDEVVQLVKQFDSLKRVTLQ